MSHRATLLIALFLCAPLVVLAASSGDAAERARTEPALGPQDGGDGEGDTNGGDVVPAARIVPDVAWKCARAHGVDEWDTVQKLSYTFSVPARDVTRRWAWKPQDNRVSFTGVVGGEETQISYTRDAIDTDLLKGIDHSFINDQYWLLFPFRLVWDSGVTITDDGEQDTPIGNGKAQRLTVAYDGDDDNGYTPGDTYYVYVDNDGVMIQWSFKPAASDEIRLSTTFEDYADFGPLKLAQRRATADGAFEILYEDIEVELIDDGRGDHEDDDEDDHENDGAGE